MNFIYDPHNYCLNGNIFVIKNQAGRASFFHHQHFITRAGIYHIYGQDRVSLGFIIQIQRLDYQ